MPIFPVSIDEPGLLKAIPLAQREAQVSLISACQLNDCLRYAIISSGRLLARTFLENCLEVAVTPVGY